ncbi:MBL fold metallo-hydrolase [Corallococcus silvisoli]|uniref:MBL fold metallo-hydrolase n=1 Tax=Corallococcus silvisoli TaxID=2697031 RepID=UPI00137767F2|nr:MBL fold metallo-hydrolase [Corallococcus silvisoli]NBD12959.1 MBL fold metallo-hydrolase [Corallococcus silvisoli]
MPKLEAWFLGGVLQRLLQSEFDPRKSRAVLERMNGRVASPVLRPQCVGDGGMVLEEEALFPEQGAWQLQFHAPEAAWHTEVPPDVLPSIAHFLRLATHGEELQGLREAWPFLEEEGLGLLHLTPAPRVCWPTPDTPGIYRREHASLLIRSRTTSILVDPVSLDRRMPQMSEAPVHLPSQGVDAVAITHGHGDHWHLPSLLTHLATPDTPVLVPRLPRISLLTPQHFEASLRACGQAVLTPAWGETVKVGDIEIDILPFYGEQPAREGPPLKAGLRNWGNCYRFTTEDFSCVLLVDGGTDPEGSMDRVMAESHARRGPVDVLLACQREFPSPFFGGLSDIWAALPWEQLQGLYLDYVAGRMKNTTAGITGIADACGIARARYFLAYANGFQGLGRPILDIGWGSREPSEATSNARLREQLAARALPTQVPEWCPGDVARFSRGQLLLERLPPR